MNLLIEYFLPDNVDRQEEYLSCLRHNLNNKHIKKIHIFLDKNTEFNIIDDKIVKNITNTRSTYKTFFDYCNKNLNGEICILSNGDIQFDDSLSIINNDNIDNKFLSLSRWDILNNGSISHYNIPYSQDCWIFKSPIGIKNCDFTLGKLGCDNRITYLAMRSGLIVTNPSKQIITKHLHLSNYRTESSDPSSIIQGMYIFVESNDNINSPSINHVVSPNNVRSMVNRLNSNINR